VIIYKSNSDCRSTHQKPPYIHGLCWILDRETTFYLP
jgi:hypothetical protein